MIVMVVVMMEMAMTAAAVVVMEVVGFHDMVVLVRTFLKMTKFILSDGSVMPC